MRIRLNRIAAAACVVPVLLLGRVLRGQQQPPPSAKIDVGALGPQVGDRVPDFSLTDQRGQVQTLASLRGSKGLVLVFFRSADW